MSKFRLLLTLISAAAMPAASVTSWARATFLNRNATGSAFGSAEAAFA